MDNTDNNMQSIEQSDDINTYIQNLQNEKMRLVEEGNYVEAENIKNKIKEIKDTYEGRNKKAISEQHQNEMKALEEEYNREVMGFHQSWEERLKEFQNKEKTEEEALNENHEKEMKALYDYLEETLPKLIYIKHSKEYLDLRQIEMNMVKQELYLEAHRIKTKADALYKEEEGKFNKEKEHKIKLKVDKLKKKQNLEKNALKEKLSTEAEMLKKNKSDELEKLILKFKNKKIDLEIQQKQEKMLTENTNMMRARTFSKINRDRQMSTINKSKQSFNFDPEIRIKGFKKYGNNIRHLQQQNVQVDMNLQEEDHQEDQHEYNHGLEDHQMNQIEDSDQN